MRHKTYYPQDQLDWLRENRNKYHYNELAPAFNQKFGTNYSTPKIYGICDANGITTDKSRQAPARVLPNEWVNWLQKESGSYEDYVSLCKTFNAHFSTNYKSRTAFKRLCDRAGIRLVKPVPFPEFAEQHFDKIKAFCQTNWMNHTRKEFTEVFNKEFHTHYDSAVCAWVSANTDRLGLPAKRMPQYQFAPSAEELDLFRTQWKSMTARDFAELCNQTIGTHYNDQQAAHRVAWLVHRGYLKDSDVRKKKKIVRKKN